METSPTNKQMSLETECISTSLEREISNGSINKHLLGEKQCQALCAVCCGFREGSHNFFKDLEA